MTSVRSATASVDQASAARLLEEADRFWVREARRSDGTSGRFGEAMLDAAELRDGLRVLDVGCGAGSTTVEAAWRVAPGTAVGVDVSGPALALASKRAADAECDNVQFIEADAQTYAFEPATFDAVISRFGTMFFEDSTEAFANLRRALRPSGRLAIVAWQGPFENEWTAVAVRVAIAVFGRPPDLGAPRTPGPFAFADGDHFRSVVTSAGFHRVELESLTRPMVMGTDVEDVVGMVAATPQSKCLFAGQPEERIQAALEGLRTGFAPFAKPEGVVMSGKAWLLTARS